MHGVFTNVHAQRVLVENWLVLPQILQRDDPTWNQYKRSDGPFVKVSLVIERCERDLLPGCPPQCSEPWTPCRRRQDPPRRSSGTCRPTSGIGRCRFPSGYFSGSRRTQSWQEKGHATEMNPSILLVHHHHHRRGQRRSFSPQVFVSLDGCAAPINRASQSFSYRDAFPGQSNARLKQILPRQPAVPLVSQLVTTDLPGYGYRQSTCPMMTNESRSKIRHWSHNNSNEVTRREETSDGPWV